MRLTTHYLLLATYYNLLFTASSNNNNNSNDDDDHENKDDDYYSYCYYMDQKEPWDSGAWTWHPCFSQGGWGIRAPGGFGRMDPAPPLCMIAQAYRDPQKTYGCMDLASPLLDSSTL